MDEKSDKTAVPFLSGGVKRIMFGGIPAKLAVVELTIFAVCVVAWHMFELIPIFAIIHFILVQLYKKDDYFGEILLGHLFEDDYLDV